MALGDDAIEPFHQILTHDNQTPDLNLAKQLIELIASHHKYEQTELTLRFLAGFTEYPEPILVEKSISHMAKYGLQAAPILQELLQSKLKYSRTYAIKALGSIHDLSAVDLLIHALQDQDYRVRSEAAEALGKINHHKAIQPLLQMFGDQNWLVRESASSALIQFSHKLINKPLITMLNDNHAQKRIQALHTLGALQRPENNPMIISALDDPNHEVQYEAINALAHTHNHIAIIPLLSHFKNAN
ncbi:MAG: HEAT repeat domain-containing protein, partial [Mariprofundaceae bacterium]